LSAGSAAPTPDTPNDDTNTNNGTHTHTAHNIGTRPCTRSTAVPTHPFFVNVQTRTGKAAKHFRKMFLPTAAMCECNLYPVYLQQLPSNAPAPDRPLPLPFRSLCLGCITRIYSDFTQPSYTDRTIAAGFLNRFVSKSMLDTFSVCYLDYYTDDEYAACVSSRQSAYNQAWEWVDERVKEFKPECDLYDRTQAELAKAAKGQKDGAADGCQ
jgi:hypothetical protein